MDDDEQKFDPVTPGTLNDIRPEFLGGNGGGGAGALGASGTSGASSAKAAEENAAGGLYRPGGSAKDEAKSKESTPGTGGLYNNGAGAKAPGGIGGRLAALRGGGKGGAGGKAGGPSAKRKGKFAGKMPMMAGGAAIVVCVIGLLALATPTLMIGALDYNLQEALGFTDTTAILEEQGEYVTADLMEQGAFGAEYAERLAANGIEVGQITAAGDFVRTNTYIAGLGEDTEVAANGGYHANGSGELVMKFKDQIIHASEFVAAVESSPEMYEAYRQGANISALYYYSKEVGQVYKDMNLSRDAFSSWERTGDAQADQESFYQLLNKMLDSVDSKLTAGDCEGEGADATCVTTNASGGDAGAIVGNIASNTTMGSTGEATTRAAELLNSTISAGEPYKGVAAFLAVEEPLQQARIDGGGPVNEAMNALMQETEVTYTDVNTGEQVTTKKSLIGSQNFTAAASAGTYSKDEAVNFSRDRIFVATGTSGRANAKNSSVGTKWQKESSTAVEVIDGQSADGGMMAKANNSVDIAVVQKNSELFQSTVGGNRAVEGGAFLSGTINQRALGSMASDEAQIAAYHQEVGEVLARQAEAERATKSPFDITSPNTFLGSIVHNLAGIMIRNWGSSGGSSAMTAVSSVADLASASVGSLLGETAVADGNDGSYAMTFGDYCKTATGAANVKADIYCTQDSTSYTGYMTRTQADWDNRGIGKNDDKEYKDFVTLGMDREVTVGVTSADVCERWKKNHKGEDWFGELADSLASVAGIYRACGYGFGDVNPDISSGSMYTLSDSNGSKSRIEEYSAFALHDAVYSLLSEQASQTSQIKEEYYKEHPKDESAAGIVARATGMTKAEAELALTYATYLAMLNEYDASERFAFGASDIDTGEMILIEHSNKLGGELYAVWSGRAKYADVRNRSFAV